MARRRHQPAQRRLLRQLAALSLHAATAQPLPRAWARLPPSPRSLPSNIHSQSRSSPVLPPMACPRWVERSHVCLWACLVRTTHFVRTTRPSAPHFVLRSCWTLADSGVSQATASATRVNRRESPSSDQVWYGVGLLATGPMPRPPWPSAAVPTWSRSEKAFAP